MQIAGWLIIFGATVTLSVILCGLARIIRMGFFSLGLTQKGSIVATTAVFVTIIYWLVCKSNILESLAWIIKGVIS